ncbi:MAG: hypothetical protein QM736_20145 [Vicinamibacterales bacterium]
MAVRLPQPKRAAPAAPPANPAANAGAGALRNAALAPPTRVTVGKNVGLHISWFTYRGPADAPVRLHDLIQIKPWEDTRAGANSPWYGIRAPPETPADGKYPVKVTFSQPGTSHHPRSRGRRCADWG